MHIAFFDSGLGGLSIAQAFFKHPESESAGVSRCSYIADTGAFPYGNIADGDLSLRIIAVLRAAIIRSQPDLVVVACNTASTLALAQLRQEFSIPFIGVVPAIKPAVHASITGVIGVLATPATVTRDYTAQLIADYAPKQQVLLYGCTQLVAQAEQQLLGLPVDTHRLQVSLNGLLQQPHGDKIDTIVLACTHFPLLKKALAQQLAQLCHNTVQWIDSGEAIARRIIQLAPSIHTRPTQSSRPVQLALFTTSHSLKITSHPLKIRSSLKTSRSSTETCPLAQQYAALLTQQPLLFGCKHFTPPIQHIHLTV